MEKDFLLYACTDSFSSTLCCTIVSYLQQYHGLLALSHTRSTKHNMNTQSGAWRHKNTSQARFQCANIKCIHYIHIFAPFRKRKNMTNNAPISRTRIRTCFTQSIVESFTQSVECCGENERSDVLETGRDVQYVVPV